MKEGPDIARLAAMIGDPARANMLTALMSGKALTASELAAVAGVTLATTSAHLAKLETGGLIVRRKQGRHRYFSLADDDVAALLEQMMGLAAEKGHTRVRTGPKDPALRKARVCYNHLAGELGVRMYDSCRMRGLLVEDGPTLRLSTEGHTFMAGLGIATIQPPRSKRPLCRPCLDWSARRTHLAGALGAGLLSYFYETGWATREEATRVVCFTPRGEAKFYELFPL
ncbi:MAG: metalloregulator ArsR/SmtB family transcription factor [Alphaproteobacteria bacterium]|nr:metalloregulator ArsR/SmtB family transcription factor [Alphaproteobacteria bacterium]